MKNILLKFKEDPEPWRGFRRHGKRWDRYRLKLTNEAASDRSKWSSDVIKSIGAGQDSSSSGFCRK